MTPTTNLRGMDLNLLTIFEVVYETGSITRGAERLGLTQPTTSHALARLREAFKDELFVRSGHGVAPTPTARQIYPLVKRALDGIRRAVGEARGFDQIGIEVTRCGKQRTGFVEPVANGTANLRDLHRMR